MPTNKELEDQLEVARKDIEALARMAGGRVRDEVSHVRDRGQAQLQELSEEARAIYDRARESGLEARAMAEDRVRENPLLACGLAMGAGFILASLMRR